MNSQNEENELRWQTRRHFFQECRLGLGTLALSTMLNEQTAGAAEPDPYAPRRPHFTPRAKNVIFLFMAGGPSQFELFDPKPQLQKYHGQPIPDSFLQGKRFAFMNSFTKQKPKCLGTKRRFHRAGQCGAWISECLPHISQIADQCAFIHSMKTDVFNHAPAKIFMNTGSPQSGRPSMGAWVSYGIGSESRNLPGFVVLQSGPRGPRGGNPLWGSGFLPTAHQGVPFRSGGDPIVNLSSPPGISPQRQREVLDVIRDLNQEHYQMVHDPEITTRIASYEMAFRMQSSAPELIDLSHESKQTLEMYGATVGGSSFANNCLLARRLVERGVRFVQLYHTDWDAHGDSVNNLDKGLDKVCQQVDRPTAALIADLKRSGLLDDTLVIWGGEFGRTPMGEIRDSIGRNHHIDAYTMFLAGGGVRPGISIGETDEFGFATVADQVHVHDLQATILHLLGIEHTRLIFRFQGRNFRLTDVYGNVVQKLIS